MIPDDYEPTSLNDWNPFGLVHTGDLVVAITAAIVFVLWMTGVI